MIIDFHTHIFPDKIAKKTIDFLAAKGNVTPYSDGSVNGLLTIPIFTNGLRPVKRSRNANVCSLLEKSQAIITSLISISI